MEARLQRIKDLISEKERIDGELDSLLGGSPVKTRKCSKCGSDEHTARTCTTKASEP